MILAIISKSNHQLNNALQWLYLLTLILQEYQLSLHDLFYIWVSRIRKAKMLKEGHKNLIKMAYFS